MEKSILILAIIAILLAACVPKVQEAKTIEEAKNITPAPNVTEAPKEVVPITPPKEEYIIINKSINTLYNDKQQKFKWNAYIIELLYVSSDGELCQIKINGQTGIYEKDKPTEFDKGLTVEMMDAVPTHGFTGDACKVALYSPS